MRRQPLATLNAKLERLALLLAAGQAIKSAAAVSIFCLVPSFSSEAGRL